MKRYFILIPVLGLLIGCSNYSAEQGEAADFLCNCLNNGDSELDPNIVYFECNEELKIKFDEAITRDEGFDLALTEKCSDKLVSE